ncbi:hypothetical protein IT415_00335 [bacterium]|nr:hypothetical protein [bacterium]
MKLVMVHRVKYFWRNRHQGSAALLTTIAISAALVVLFVGITTITTREVRQSIATDHSNRALYAAQAGVEDAVRRLNEDVDFANEENTCNASNSGNAVDVGVGTNAAWTCRTISLQSSTIEGRLDKDQAVTINLAKSVKNDGTTPAEVKYMSIQWSKSDFDTNNPVGSLTTYDRFLPGTGGWGNRAAAIQVTGVWFPKPNLATAEKLIDGTLPVRSLLLSPVNSGDADGVQDFSNWNQASNTTLTDLKSGMSVKCVAVATYSCSAPANFAGAASTSNTYALEKMMAAPISNGDGTAAVVKCQLSQCNLVLRLQARYAATHFQIRFYYEDGSTLREALVQDGYATIDVTARSATYYRRVVAKKKLLPTVTDGVFDNALFSGGPICKTMTVYKDNRGAPDKVQQPDGTLIENARAGYNSCD